MRIFSRSQLTYSVQSVPMMLMAVTLISCGQADVQSFKPDAVVAMQPQQQGTSPTATFTPLPFETPKIELTHIAEREQHEAQTAAADTPVPRTTYTPAPTVWPPPTPEWLNATPLAKGGALVDEAVHVYGVNLEAHTFWGYVTDDTHFIMVKAVSGTFNPPANDVQQGGVVVEVYENLNEGAAQQSQDYYLTPNTSGSARITDAAVSDGVQRVLVQTDGGSTFIFNVTTRQWERGTVLPTPMMPTATRTASPTATR